MPASRFDALDRMPPRELATSIGEIVTPVELWDIHPSAIEDAAPKLARAIAELSRAGGGTLSFGAGTYLLNSTVAGASNVSLQGLGSLSRIVGGVGGPSANLLSLSAVTNVTIRNLHFSATTATRAIFVQGSDNVTVEGCTADGLELFNSTAESGFTYATMTEAKQSSRLRVLNNYCVGDGAGLAIYATWSRDVVIADNTVENYAHGIAWWGGSADPVGGDGASGNPRWANDYVIRNNVIRDVAGGGIWGSNGERMAITGNVVEDCGDVCIDIEGGQYITVAGNTAKNGTNGCYTLFFRNDGIVFSGNVGSSSVDGQRLVWFTSNEFSADNKNIAFVGNTFIHTGAGRGSCLIGTAMVDNLLFAENTLSNVAIDFAPTQVGHTSILNNQLLFTNLAGAAFNAIQAGGQMWNNVVATKDRVRIAGNKVVSRVAQPAGSRAIYSVMQVFSGAPTITVDGNTTEGFPIDLECATTSQDGTVVPRQLVSNNVFTAGVFTRTDAGNDVAQVILTGNRLNTGAPYPAATPGSGKWNVGQIAYTAAPAAAGFIGAVCTAAGSPGTWKNFGAIEA